MPVKTNYSSRPDAVELVHAHGKTYAFIRQNIEEVVDEDGNTAYRADEYLKIFEGTIETITQTQIEAILHPVTIEDKISNIEDALVELAEIIGG